MNIIKLLQRVALLSLLVFGMVGCGGGGGDGTTPPPPPPSSTFSISGIVSGAITDGVTINLTGATTATIDTAAGGTYTLLGLANGIAYTVTPVRAGYSFSPPNVSGTISGANVTSANFTATALTSTLTLSGTVGGNNVTSGVTVALVGATTATDTTTGSDGSYSFSGLTRGGNYTVTPSIAGNAFTPASITVNNIEANSAGNNFTAETADTFTLSGTISGPYVEGVAVVLGNGRRAITDENGAYSFVNLATDMYTITPALPGYTYAPAAPSVTVSADTTQNFTASSTVANHSISGTVTYGGAKTGVIYVRVTPASCGGCDPEAGTMITAPGPYTVRGLRPNTAYTVTAERDSLDNGAPNATKPIGQASATVVTADRTGIDIALADPATDALTPPTGLTVAPGDASALISWDRVRNANGVERVTDYQIHWGTNNPPTGGTITVPAVGDDGTMVLQASLTNGTPYFYQVTSRVGATASAKSAVVGPITIDVPSGANTVTGTVTFPGIATGPLLVIVFNSNTEAFHFTRIAAPVSPQRYTITGVPAGSYSSFANIDMNNNGHPFDLGDITNIRANVPTINVNGVTTGNLVLGSATALASVRTHYTLSDTGSASYQLELGVADGVRRVVKATLVSGNNMPVPLDLGRTNNNDLQHFRFLGATEPAVGESYVYKITYSDGDTETFTRSVSAVLGAANAPRSLVTVTNGTGGSTATLPLFTWMASTTPPLTAYSYDVQLYGGNAGWSTDGSLASTILQIRYNVNGSANVPTLTSGTPYTWRVDVVDANGNTARQEKNYTP